MKKYYEFLISLNTPYKWGEGYGNATDDEIESNQDAFDKMFYFLKGLEPAFTIDFEKEERTANKWYVDFTPEEIYAHPMELSGVLELSKLEKLIDFIKESDFENTRLISFRIVKKVKGYTFREILDVINNESELMLPNLIKEYGYQLPMNYDFKEFELEFKTYPFVNNAFNRKQKKQKEFFLDYLNELLKEKYNEKEKNIF